ncbi:hypothetical protein LTR85_000733 [Meristemomyces frigidus]|nr:hypothetical protein LTR85_000733 [Meristemomyces frigidus]
MHWFEVIGKVVRDPAILAENVYNMDETGVMLSMLGSVKVLVGKDDTRDYRGARVKRTTVTAIECISGDELIRPLLDEVQRTPHGLERRHTISMVMVDGGEENVSAFRASAKGSGDFEECEKFIQDKRDVSDA